MNTKCLNCAYYGECKDEGIFNEWENWFRFINPNECFEQVTNYLMQPVGIKSNQPYSIKENDFGLMEAYRFKSKLARNSEWLISSLKWTGGIMETNNNGD